MVLELFHVLFVFDLLGESLPGLSVPFDDHNLQVLEKMGLVRPGNCHEILIFAVRSGDKNWFILRYDQVGLITCGGSRSDRGARLITDVCAKHMRRSHQQEHMAGVIPVA